MKFSSCGRYLISIGNHRQDTLAVWNFDTGRLLSSTFTVNTMNDLTIKTQETEGELDFCTAGHNIISFWSVTDNVLSGKDVKISTNDIEISAIEYCFPITSEAFVLIGFTNGENPFVIFKILRKDYVCR